MPRFSSKDAFSALTGTARHIQRKVPYEVLTAKSWQDKKDPTPQASETPSARFSAWLLSRAIDGTPFFLGAHKLARQYRAKTPDVGKQIASLVRVESGRGFAVGFAAGLGGLVAVPVSLPASFVATYLIQARMVATIALLWGHNLDELWVRSTILLALEDSEPPTPKSHPEGAEDPIWADWAKKAAAPVLASVQQRATRALIQRASLKHKPFFMRALPVVGAVVGGTVDAKDCMKVAQRAQELFRPTQQ